MSEYTDWTIDMRLKVTAPRPEDAAALCALLLKFGVDSGLPIEPQFVGVRPLEREPDGIDQIIREGRGEPEPKQPDDQAHSVFDGIMQAPPM